MKKLMLAALVLAGLALGMTGCANPEWIPGDSGMSGRLVPVDAHGMFIPAHEMSK